jgi:hypothetical protein
MEQGQTGRSWLSLTCPDITPEDRANQNRFAVWALVWSIAFVGASMILESGAVTGPAAWAVALAPTVCGVLAVWAYVVFLRRADELLRKIHLEALALGFGGGMLFMMGYRLLERAGAPGLDMNDPLLVMCLVWAGTLLVLTRRYS